MLWSRLSHLEDLGQAVGYCNICPRMKGRSRVLSELNGNPCSKVLFVAEAPGRLGADRTRIPLYGDVTGRRFETFLSNIGWDRSRVFVTNAVLCNPQDEAGNNDGPKKEEIENCLPYLEMVIALVDPAVVVALGSTALRACGMIDTHAASLQCSVAEAVPWYDRLLFPLYHPGPRASVHRSIPKQRADYMRLAGLVDPERGLRARRGRADGAEQSSGLTDAPSNLMRVCLALVRQLREVSYFKLTKLVYLSDLASLRTLGRQLTNEIFLRQADGPWSPALPRATRAMCDYELQIKRVRGMTVMYPGIRARFEPDLSDQEAAVVAEVLAAYGHMSEKALKTAVYLSDPMRYILRQEGLGRNMRNALVLYANKLAPELDRSKAGRDTLF